MPNFRKAASQSWIDSHFCDFGDEPTARTSDSTGKKRPRESQHSLKRSGTADDCRLNRKTRRATEDDSSLWVERHSPDSSSLAVNPKKVQEVKAWFTNEGNTAKILLLSGPPGCGKTAALKVIAREVGRNVQEWINPTEVVAFQREDDGFKRPYDDAMPYVSQIKKFKDFIRRSSKYKQVGVASGSSIILIEDLPSFAFRNPEEFQSILQTYNNGHTVFPLVIIQSETSTDDDYLKHIFPSDFMFRAGITKIQFNPITTTNMVKALTAIALQESEAGVRRFPVPPKEVMTSLAETTSGDIRAAINALQFACLNDTRDLKDSFNSYNSLASSSKQSKSNSKVKAKKGETQSTLASIGGKDPTIDLFHAIGKVLYCKREDVAPRESLPEHLKGFQRRPLKSNPEEILEKTPMSEDAFVCFVHQSYLRFSDNIHAVSEAAGNLSLSEPFFSGWTTTGKISLSEYGGLISTRGIMFSSEIPPKASAMRTFNKPEWYNVAKSSRSKSQVLKSIFQHRGLPFEELSTTFVPLLSMINPGGIRREAADVGLFPSISGGNRCNEFTAPVTEGVECSQEDEEDVDFLIEDCE